MAAELQALNTIEAALDRQMPGSELQAMLLERIDAARLNVGAPVPAGRYAREALKKAGVWDTVKSRVLEGGDVRAALLYVAREEAEAGIVYTTDVRASDRVKVALEVKPELHRPIRYPLVLIHRNSMKRGSQQLFKFLGGEQAAAIFRQAGFGVVPAP